MSSDLTINDTEFRLFRDLMRRVAASSWATARSIWSAAACQSGCAIVVWARLASITG